MWLPSVSKTCVSCYRCDCELRDTQTHLSTHPLLARTHEHYTLPCAAIHHEAAATATSRFCPACRSRVCPACHMQPGRTTLTHSMAGVRPWCEIQSNLSSIARGANSRRVHEELEDSHADHAASQHSQRERTSERQPVSKQPASSGVLSASVRLSRSQYVPVCSSDAACHEQVGQKSSEVHDCPSLPEPTSPIFLLWALRGACSKKLCISTRSN